MRKLFVITLVMLATLTVTAQITREFTVDTANFISELRDFTGMALESTEQPDFEAFVRMFDSIPYKHQMEVITVSNLMLKKKCRPRPHFISFQRVMLEFLTRNKTSHGYDEWLTGYSSFLQGDAALHSAINQWLALTYSPVSYTHLRAHET